jgi:hypothetical protein
MYPVEYKKLLAMTMTLLMTRIQTLMKVRVCQ